MVNMKTNSKYLLVLVGCVSAFPVFAALSDDACRDRNGLAINSRECIEYRKENKTLSDVDCFNTPECRLQKERMAEVRRLREEQIKKAEQEVIARDEAAANKTTMAAAAEKKAKCGEDYKRPRIGMSIDRVKECVTSVKMTGQLNRADGVITTYEGGNAYFHVMASRIVSWGKY